MTTALELDRTEHSLAAHALRLATVLAGRIFTLTVADADGTPLRVLPGCTFHHPAIGWDAEGSFLRLVLRQEYDRVQHAAYHRLAAFVRHTPPLTLHEDDTGLAFLEHAPYPHEQPLAPPAVLRTTRLTWAD